MRNGEEAGIVTQQISSLGADITADNNLFRFYAPVNLGVRAVYLPASRNVSAEMLFSIDFTSF